MTILTAYAIDDEITSLKLVEEFIKEDKRVKLIGSESDPIKAKEWLLNTDQLPDILFLDIEMKKLNGMALAEIFRGKTMIVFSTGYRDFAVESYKYDAIDYLLKPYSPERFKDAIDRCVKEMELNKLIANETENEFYVRDTVSYDNARIIKRKILYLEANGNYTKIFLEDSPYKMPKLSMKRIMEILGNHNFFQVHKGTVVNLDQIASFNSIKITLFNGAIIALGPTFRKEFMERMEHKSAY